MTAGRTEPESRRRLSPRVTVRLRVIARRTLASSLFVLIPGLLLGGCGSGQRTEGAPRAGAAAPRRAPARSAQSGIPAGLLAGERPIGRGVRFEPPLVGRPSGSCTATLGRRDEAHVEIFAADRVVLLAAGIGTAPPRRLRDGRLLAAQCFASIVTLDDTGTVYFRPGSRPALAALFREWGQPLSPARIASFTGGSVQVFLNGRRAPGDPRELKLAPDDEVVLEIGPHVPPHAHFTFPPLPAARMR